MRTGLAALLMVLALVAGVAWGAVDEPESNVRVVVPKHPTPHVQRDAIRGTGVR